VRRDTNITLWQGGGGSTCPFRYVGRRELPGSLPRPAKLGIVVEEADETQYWLELLAETGLIKLSQLTPLMKEAGELVAIFTAGQRTAKQNS
jgi:hypothetical protein